MKTTLARKLTFGSNANLTFGAALLLLIVFFAAVGPLFVDPKMAQVGATDPRLAPSGSHLMGTDIQGRDVLSELVRATPATLGIGLIAGIIGVTIGTVLGILAGYFGGVIDSVIRVVT
ncbi:MAG TPA: D,D-dipeptide ABC transporter permease, partial [Spirochaetia bacterium]|nr:D,D-dipeptide ABC transporter permease [Spirochaetia bacterium]